MATAICMLAILAFFVLHPGWFWFIVGTIIFIIIACAVSSNNKKEEQSYHDYSAPRHEPSPSPQRNTQWYSASAPKPRSATAPKRRASTAESHLTSADMYNPYGSYNPYANLDSNKSSDSSDDWPSWPD